MLGEAWLSHAIIKNISFRRRQTGQLKNHAPSQKNSAEKWYWYSRSRFDMREKLFSCQIFTTFQNISGRQHTRTLCVCQFPRFWLKNVEL
jgi:hypothetical protein